MDQKSHLFWLNDFSMRCPTFLAESFQKDTQPSGHWDVTLNQVTWFMETTIFCFERDWMKEMEMFWVPAKYSSIQAS